MGSTVLCATEEKTLYSTIIRIKTEALYNNEPFSFYSESIFYYNKAFLGNEVRIN